MSGRTLVQGLEVLIEPNIALHVERTAEKAFMLSDRVVALQCRATRQLLQQVMSPSRFHRETRGYEPFEFLP